MIIKTYKKGIEKVFGFIYTVGLNKFKFGTESSYYEISVENIPKMIEGLMRISQIVKRQKALYDNTDSLETAMEKYEQRTPQMERSEDTKKS